MSKVILINPALSTMGYSVITPRWLFVVAQATPTDLVGNPVLIDEAIEKFDLGLVSPGDIVGIGISTGNCLAGYNVLREAKSKGATVIMGGIHPTIFPDEPLEMGADAVVTGNGDLVWSKVIRDALNHTLQRRYIGGRVPGDSLLRARWDLLDPRQYMFPTVQTVAGCPENCSFCSVWVTDGRQPRQRLTSRIIFSWGLEEQRLARREQPSSFREHKNARNWPTLALGQSTRRNDLMIVFIMAFVIAVLVLLGFMGRLSSRR